MEKRIRKRKNDVRYPGSCLGQITSGKRAGAQNRKRRNRDMRKNFKMKK